MKVESAVGERFGFIVSENKLAYEGEERELDGVEMDVWFLGRGVGGSEMSWVQWIKKIRNLFGLTNDFYLRYRIFISKLL